LFNFNTTAENLADPAMRSRIVLMTRAIIDAAAELRGDPDRAQRLLSEASGFALEDIRKSWKHHAFTAALPDDMLDVLVEQEIWLAQQENRQPRGREELARLIDTSVYEEAMALEPLRPRR